MSHTLVFLEFADEAQAYVRECHDSAAARGSQAVALSMASQLVLKRAGIPFQTSLPYFDNHAHSRALICSEQWLKRIEESLEMDDILITELVFALRPMFNYLLWLSEVASQAVREVSPQVICGPPAMIPGDDPHWRPTSQYRPLGYFLQQLAQRHQLEYIELSVSPAKEKSPVGAGKTVSKSLGIFHSILYRRLRKRLSDGKYLFTTTNQYSLGKITLDVIGQMDMDDEITALQLNPSPGAVRPKPLLKLIHSLLRRSGSPHLLSLPLYAFPPQRELLEDHTRQLNDGLNYLVRQMEGPWREQFRHRDLDIVPCLAPKLTGGIRFRMLETISEGARVSRALKDISPFAVLSPHSFGVTAYIGMICRQMNIPALLLPHGSLAPPADDLEEIEQRRLSQGQILGYYSHSAAQTPLAAAHARHYRASHLTYNTGPVIWAKTDPQKGEVLREDLNIPADTALVVYAVAQRKRTSIHFHVFETEDENLAAMIDLVEAVNRLDNVHLVLKLHPSSEFTEEDMRFFLPPCERLSVLHKEPFSDVLSAADLLVSYISTTVEEALLNRIPVVLYDKWRRYRHVESADCNHGDPGDWPVDGAYYASDAERLDTVLRHALENSQKARSSDVYDKHAFKPGEIRPLQSLLEKWAASQKNT